MAMIIVQVLSFGCFYVVYCSAQLFQSNTAILVSNYQNGRGLNASCINKIVTGYTENSCALQCLQEVWCKSYNVKPTEGKCELSSETHLSQNCQVTETSATSYQYFKPVIDAMFKDIWHPVTVNGEVDHPARMFIGSTVVSYIDRDNISSIDPISVTLPGYNQNRVDAILQGPIENDQNEILYIFLDNQYWTYRGTSMKPSNGPHLITDKFGSSPPFNHVDLAMMNGPNVIIVEGDNAFTYVGQNGSFALESTTPMLLSEVNFPSGVHASLQNAQEIEQGAVLLLKDFKCYMYSFKTNRVSETFSVAIL